MLFCYLCHKKNVVRSYSTNGFIYYLCQNCQILFLHPQPAEKIIKDFYINKYRQEAALNRKTELTKRSKIIIRKLIKLNPSGKTLLDIGSGYGFFLNEARRNKFRILGLEPSRFLYDYSIKRSKLNVINNDLQTFSKNNEKVRFDFITLIHVIEHVKNPKQFICQACDLLKPGGVLYIETPNLHSHLFASEKQNYTFLTPPDHLYIFSLQYFETLKNSNRLQLISTSTYSYPEHFMGIIKRCLIPTTFTQRSPAKRDEVGFTPNEAAGEVGQTSLIKKLKYFFFDLFLAKIFYRLLDFNNKGSILELYYKKL